MPLKPRSQTQVKFPAGWLMQRPRAPQTLEGMFCMPSESLVATAMLQLSIAVKNKPKKKASFRFSVFLYYRSIPASFPPADSFSHLDMEWFGNPLWAFHTSFLRSLQDTHSRSPVPCYDTWPHSHKGLDRRDQKMTSLGSLEKMEKRGGEKKDKQNKHIKRVTVAITRPMMEKSLSNLVIHHLYTARYLLQVMMETKML